MSRKPLQSYPNMTMPGQVNPDLIDTPVTHASGKITTPPYSIYTKRNNQVLETPIRPSESSSSAPKNVLLSPAFSSPQTQNTHSMTSISDQSKTALLVPPPAPFSNPAASPFSTPPMPNFESLLGSNEEGNKRKTVKTKRPRTNSTDASFSIDSNEKPPYSYATLIGMSILTHPDRQLTLSQIYQWISETFKYYRREDVGWQNSIRHNLSLNKAFVKGAKSKDGKGHFWCIKPECEDLFLKAKNNKKSSYQEVMDQLAISRRSQTVNQIPSSPTNAEDSKKRTSESVDGLEQDTKKKQKSESSNREDFDIDGEEHGSQSVLRTPNRLPMVNESPYRPMTAGKNMTFTSSFSCSSNFELSPAQHLQTGPLLEPLTPATSNVLLQQSSAATKGPVQLPSITLNRVVSHHLPQLQPSIPNSATPRAAGTARTPKTNIKTPVRTLKTPSGSTLMKKLWHSPSYLEEFYYSPFAGGKAIFNSYDDEDMLMRAFDSPSSSSREGRVNLFHELKTVDKEASDVPSSDATEVDGSEVQ